MSVLDVAIPRALALIVAPVDVNLSRVAVRNAAEALLAESDRRRQWQLEERHLGLDR